MGYKDYIVPREVPGFGAIFMSNIETKKECFRRKLFGLPSAMSNFVLQVKEGTMLFLFEFERRQLYGVFRATSDGEINIESSAFKSSGKQFPAQVRFTQIWNCSPLAEHEFQDAIRDNYYSRKKFNFGLSEDQVRKLMMLLRAKRIPKMHPERSFWREGDMPARIDRKFDDGKNLVRDRIEYTSEEDGHGLDMGDEVKELDNSVYLNRKIAKNVHNFNYDRGQGNMIFREERTWGEKEDEFLTNNVTRGDVFDDDGTRQDILGKRLHRSLGGLRRAADAGLYSMSDVIDKHDIQNMELKGIANKGGSYMMNKIKGKHDIEDGYLQMFIEPHENYFGEIRLAGYDSTFLMDSFAKRNEHHNRIQDEFRVTNGFRRSVSAHHHGSPSNRGSPRFIDDRFFGHETVEIEERKLTGYPLNKLRGTIDVVPNARSSVGGVISTNDSYVAEQLRDSFESDNIGKVYDSGLSCRDFTKPIFYDPEVLHIQRKRSSYFAGEGHRYHPFYTTQNEGSMRYLTDDPGYDTTRDTCIFDENRLFRSEGLRFPECVETAENTSKTHASKEDSINENSCENKHVDRRFSVFARLTSAPEEETKIADLDASVNKVMKMLEKVVSRAGKRDNKTESNAIESGSLLEETRLVDFKRRKKANTSSTGLVSDDIKRCCKRPKLVRPAFVMHHDEPTCSGSTKAPNDAQVAASAGGAEGEASSQVQRRGTSREANEQKMCGWIEW